MEDKYLEFQRRKLKYEADLIKYQEALARWNALSDTEKSEAHRSAEGLSLIGWSLLVAGGIAFLLYQHFNERLSGDVFWFSWTVATLFVAALAIAFKQVVGRLARGTAFSALFGVIWPAAGFKDTELGVSMKLEVRHGATQVYARV